ncbi:MAG: glucosyltransferase domain-containing protein, partial [Rudaea sp.]
MSGRNEVRSPPLLPGTGRLPLARWLQRDLWILLLIFCLFYFYRLSEFSLSIDDELEAGGDHWRVWILTGRWAGFVIDHFVLPQSTVPFLPIFLFGVFMCLAYRVILRAFEVPRIELAQYLTFPFFVAL